MCGVLECVGLCVGEGAGVCVCGCEYDCEGGCECVAVRVCLG